jgi:hypothetical protein
MDEVEPRKMSTIHYGKLKINFLEEKTNTTTNAKRMKNILKGET